MSAPTRAAFLGGASEFTAVILASANDGDNLHPLTEHLPPALLPVANRPLISFQLELLERAGSFQRVLVLTIERWLTLLSTYVSEEYKGPLQVELLVVPDDAGSADAIRHIRAKLLTDFVLLAGDVITDASFQRLADLHRLSSAAVTALYKERPPREVGVVKKARDLDGVDFVGVDEKRTRLLSLEAAADCDQGVVSVSQSMLGAYPKVELHTNLVDAHVYIFSHWVLDVLELKPHFSSAKLELLPYLVRKQFLPKANLAFPADGPPAAPPADGSPPPSPKKLELQMSSGGEARRASTNTSDFRCCCFIMPHDGGYTLRANDLKTYMAANLDVAKGGVTLYAAAAEAWLESASPKGPTGGRGGAGLQGGFSAMTLDAGKEAKEAKEAKVAKEAKEAKEGKEEGAAAAKPVVRENYVLKSFSSDCSRGAGIEVAQRSSIKKSCIGPHCHIGANVRMTNCIVMDHVVIGDKVTMSNCVVCAHAEVREGAKLQDVQVAQGATVEAGAVVKEMAVTSSATGAGGGGSDLSDE